MFKKININELKKYEFNPRKISESQKQKLENSINTFGFVDPIIINNKTKQIIGGHQRYDVLLNNNIDELYIIELGDISWVFSELDLNVLDDNYEKALNIALNKISGEWDTEKLDILNQKIDIKIEDDEDDNESHFFKYNIVFNDNTTFDDFLKILDRVNDTVEESTMTKKILKIIKDNIL